VEKDGHAEKSPGSSISESNASSPKNSPTCDFKRQDTFDLHIALGVERDVFDCMMDKARASAVEVRGPVAHGFCRSIYMCDPSGCVVELTGKTGVQQYPAVLTPQDVFRRGTVTPIGSRLGSFFKAARISA
jgi:hypothetical protein